MGALDDAVETSLDIASNQDQASVPEAMQERSTDVSFASEAVLPTEDRPVVAGPAPWKEYLRGVAASPDELLEDVAGDKTHPFVKMASLPSEAKLQPRSYDDAKAYDDAFAAACESYKADVEASDENIGLIDEPLKTNRIVAEAPNDGKRMCQLSFP